jgi:hypothetical protein
VLLQTVRNPVASYSAMQQCGSMGPCVLPSYQYSASTTASLFASSSSTGPNSRCTCFEMLPSDAFSLTWVSGCARPSSTEVIARSTSYWTLIFRSASSANRSESAATAAMASPT